MNNEEKGALRRSQTNKINFLNWDKLQLSWDEIIQRSYKEPVYYHWNTEYKVR